MSNRCDDVFYFFGDQLIGDQIKQIHTEFLDMCGKWEDLRQLPHFKSTTNPNAQLNSDTVLLTRKKNYFNPSPTQKSN